MQLREERLLIERKLEKKGEKWMQETTKKK